MEWNMFHDTIYKSRKRKEGADLRNSLRGRKAKRASKEI